MRLAGLLLLPLSLLLPASLSAGCSQENDSTATASTADTAGTAGTAGTTGAASAAGAAGTGAAGASGAPQGGSGGTSSDLCIGVKPDKGAWGASPSVAGEPPSTECPDSPTCPGSPWPLWRLPDVQPQSCGYGATYGLDTFLGQTTVVVLLAGWCGFCQAQAVALQKMDLELQAEGKKIHFVVVNAQNAAANQQELLDRCNFPLFQDMEGANVWQVQGGSKDDFFLYDRTGKLHAYLPHTGSTPTNLSTPEGYAALKAAILAVP